MSHVQSARAHLARSQVVLVSAHATADVLPVSPEYAAILVDEALVQRIEGLAALCESHGLSEARVVAYPQSWGPEDIEDELRLQGGELVVRADASFWFTDYPKHGDTLIETQVLDLAGVIEAVVGHEDPELPVVLIEDADYAAEGEENYLQGRNDLEGALAMSRRLIASGGEFPDVMHRVARSFFIEQAELERLYDEAPE